MTIEQTRTETLRVGIDIGGTFTDFVIFYPSGEITTFKIPSIPEDPSKAVMFGLEKIRGMQKERINLLKEELVPVHQDWHIIHGSTVATNALLERKGALTALITTGGFKDVIQIGRQNRPDLYDFFSKPIEPLVPEYLRLEANERTDFQGKILIPLEEDEIDRLVNRLIVLSNGDSSTLKLHQHRKQSPVKGYPDGIESVAIVLLFSFANSEHEKRIATRLRQEGYFVSASNEVLPEYREYERASTTIVNAYVSPVLDRYLRNLETISMKEGLGKTATPSGKITKTQLKVSDVQFQVMQSNGGCISLSEARKNGVKCILSGPAGGVVGSWFYGRLLANIDSTQIKRKIRGKSSF